MYRHRCLNRIYLAQSKGRLGLIEINHACLKSSEEESLRMMEQKHSDTLPQETSIIKLAENCRGGFIIEREDDEHMPATKIARNIRIQYNKKVKKNRIYEWKKTQKI